VRLKINDVVVFGNNSIGVIDGYNARANHYGENAKTYDVLSGNCDFDCREKGESYVADILSPDQVIKIGRL
jgi:hypothetical protein